MNKIRHFVLSCMAGLLLSGCSALIVAESAQQMSKELIFGESVNLTEKSYAAADYLVPQMRSFVDDFDVIKAEALTNIDAPTISSKLARLIPEQVGSRLAQLGYHMDLSDVIPKADQTFHDASATKKSSDHILRGTYRNLGNEFDINLRVIDVSTNRIIAVFDYQLQQSTDLKKLADPEASISIISQ